MLQWERAGVIIVCVHESRLGSLAGSAGWKSTQRPHSVDEIRLGRPFCPKRIHVILGDF